MLATLLTSMTPSAIAADIYGMVDTDGTPHFTNVPNSDRFHLVLRNRDNYTVKTDDRYRRRSAADEAKPEFDASQPYGEAISREALSNKIDPFLIDAVIAVESHHNPVARSPKGALGLMQVLPETGLRYGIENVAHPDNNIRAGARYLRELLTMFDGDLSLTLAAYNAGENAVIRHGNRIPPYAETQDYVPRVMKKYLELRAIGLRLNESPIAIPVRYGRKTS